MTQIRNQFLAFCLTLLISMPAWAQDPGASLGTSLQTMFTGPLVLGITIVGIVVGGAMIMFGGHMAMRAMGGILIGGVLVLDAVKIATYLQSVI
ncbi:MAG: TrbC/VirB2 family protein [Acidobacteriaceae bacterium]|nr:TrbC/VirB2 family protein [Acidobacteriaceae bacterium]